MRKGPRLKYAVAWASVLAGGTTLLWGLLSAFVLLPRWRQQGQALSGLQVLLLRAPLILFPAVFLPTFLAAYGWFRREDHREERP